MIYVENTNSGIWNKCVYQINNADIYFTSKYHSLYENTNSIAKCFIYIEDEKIALYPFMLNEIKGYDLKEKYYDIESVYGYSGPIFNTEDEYFLKSFEEDFENYCVENNIIAEFIRFHPMIKNENIFKNNIEVINNRLTVYLNLQKGIDNIWKEDIKSKNRNMIRKAQKSNLRVEISNDYKLFKNMYEKTMNKVNADSFYYFDDEYFDLISNDENYILLNVLQENNLIASGLFIKYNDYFHYHLGASLEEYLQYAPNNFMLWEAINIAYERNSKIFHFGGGLSNDKEDKLFKFKSSFSNEYLNFCIGKRIHNKKVYEKLINEWEMKNNKSAKLFLQYKY